MEISYKDLEKLSFEDVISITSFTETDPNKRSIDECLEEAIIETTDGYIRIIPTDEERRAATEAFANFVDEVAVSRFGHLSQEKADIEFERLYRQCERGNDYDEEIWYALVNAVEEFERDEKKSSDLKNALIAGGIMVGAAALAAGGVMAYDHFTQQEKEVEETDETLKPEIKGTSWENYQNVAPESVQKEFYTELYADLEKFNSSLGDYTYTAEDGTVAKLGLTVEQGRLLKIIGSNYTNEKIAQILNGEELSSDYLTELNEIFEVFQYCFKLGDFDAELLTPFFQTEHDKEVIRKFVNGNNKIMTATTDELREQAMRDQRELWDLEFVSDVTDSQTKVSDKCSFFLLRTMLNANQEYARAFNIRGTEDVYYLKNGVETPKSVKTDLYGEQFDNSFRAKAESADEAFSQDNYLKRHGLDADKYFLIYSDQTMSFTDASCNAVIERVGNYIEYARALKNSDVELSAVAQLAAKEAQINALYEKIENGKELTAKDLEVLKEGDSLEVTTQYDEITKLTYPIEDIEELMKEKLNSLGHYPENVHLFAEKWVKLQEAIKDLLYEDVVVKSSGNKKGTGSNPINHNLGATTEENRATAMQDLINRGVSATEAAAMLDQAEAEENAREGILGKDNAETQQKAEANRNEIQAAAQAKHDEVYNKAYSYWVNVGPNGLAPSFESQYLNDYTPVDKNDTNGKLTVRDAYINGKEAGIGAYVNNHPNDYTTGGDVIIDDAFKDYIVDPSNPSDVIEQVAPKEEVVPAPTEVPTVPETPVVPEVPVTPEVPETPAVDGEFDVEIPDNMAPIVDPTTIENTTTVFDEQSILDQVETKDVEEPVVEEVVPAPAKVEETVTEPVVENTVEETVVEEVPVFTAEQIDQIATEIAQEIVNETPSYDYSEYETGGEVVIDPAFAEYVQTEDTQLTK